MTAAERVQAVFERNFERGVEVGAAVSIWEQGKEVISLYRGWMDGAKAQPWGHDTMVLVWSATKGLSSACMLHALEQAGLDLSTRVSNFWPEFAQGGKTHLTVAEIASHRAGLAALDDKTANLLDHASVIAAVEKQEPLWELGDGHGYGPRTYGYIADEIVRRLTGTPLNEYFRTQFGEPLGLDLWIGVPPEQHERIAQMLAARAGCGDAESAFAEAMAVPDSLTRKAFTGPAGPAGASAMNTPEVRAHSLPSLGGIGSASALAKFYSMLSLGGEWEGRTYFSAQALEWMTTRLAQGPDKTLQTETSFSAGFMLDPLLADGRKKRFTFGPSLKGFGHPGAGGSLAFADPENGVSFAYVMNQMEMGVLPRTRAVSLVQAFYDFP